MATRVDARVPLRNENSPASSQRGQAAGVLGTPSRLRKRTIGEEDLRASAGKRSSWISHTETPVPAIPKRFLADSPSSSRRSATPTRSKESHTHSSGRLRSYSTGPSAPPLPHHSDNTAASHHQPRPSPSRHPNQTVRFGNVVASDPATNFQFTFSPTPRHRKGASLGSALDVRSKNQNPHPLRQNETASQTSTRRDHSMEPTQTDANEDLFLQLAEDSNDEPTLTQQRTTDHRATSRSSWHDKRHRPSTSTTLSSGENNRPRTSGQQRPSSRFSTHIDTGRSTPGYAAGFTSPRYDSGTTGNAHARRPNPYSTGLEYSPRTLPLPQEAGRSPERSPELPTFGRRRPSFGYPSTNSHNNRHGSQSAKQQDSEGDSPADSSEAKRSAAESDSVDSQTAPSTVWDELDDLKSRIKKLELTGKIPSTSNAAVSGGMGSERPRTATTAPTTINSSPKQERKPDADARSGAQDLKSPSLGQLTLADIHPNLHVALGKAKALLSASLYRTLDATATDALQLVAMTGSAGPQGTTFSAASIINGVTVSDRHIRRKADLMCRNLTDLCLALCEGKHEAPTFASSPIAMETPPKISAPKSKYSRSSLAFGEDLTKVANRPLSRLEARRSSILGVQPNMLSSPQASGDDISISEHETTPSQPHRGPDPRRASRLSNRLSAPRFDRYEDVSGDDDVRAPSRAMTEIGNFRSPNQHSPRDYNNNTVSSKLPHRSPSLRESLSARRANAAAHENNRDVPRVASLNLDASRRRFTRESTPPVMEEDLTEHGAQSQQNRRIMSYGHQYSSRRALDSPANRTSSVSYRRPSVMIE